MLVDQNSIYSNGQNYYYYIFIYTLQYSSAVLNSTCIDNNVNNSTTLYTTQIINLCKNLI